MPVPESISIEWKFPYIVIPVGIVRLFDNACIAPDPSLSFIFKSHSLTSITVSVTAENINKLIKIIK